MEMYSIYFNGTYYRIVITNNTISQFAGIGDPVTWVGVLIGGGPINNGQISNNVIQGSGDTGSTCIELLPGASGAASWVISNNQLNSCGVS